MRESYQQRMLESKSKVIICDWDRGKGKSYSIADFIKEKANFNMPIKILVVEASKCRAFAILQEKLKEVIESDVYDITIQGFDKLVITKTVGCKKYNLVNITITSNVESSRGIKVDYVLCDEYIPSSDELSMFYNNGAKQVYVLGTFDIDYISDNNINVDKNTWINEEINKLMVEFSNIPKEENTTKRRDIILNMIERLEHMRVRSK